MHFIAILVALILFTSANVLSSYLYLYPIAKRCAFAGTPPQLRDGKLIPGHAAPFRLLVLGDPQLEGSTSFLSPDYEYFSSLQSLFKDAEGFNNGIRDFVHTDVPVAFQSLRKRLDLFGNDYYLAHIYRSLQWFAFPTHTAVLGDLLGSQWIDDAEFEKRGRRFWSRVFAGGQKVEDEITGQVSVIPLGQDPGWKKRVINVAGNHDVGYAGDMKKERVDRFDRVFGRSNWQIRFTLPMTRDKPVPELRLVVLNSMNLDGPALDADLQQETFAFVKSMVNSEHSHSSATILLTHVPLYKEESLCADGPRIEYNALEHGGGIREQNHLSIGSSKRLLSDIYAMGSQKNGTGHRGVILTGHDHEGCDTYHHLPLSEDGAWKAEKWDLSSPRRHAGVHGIREITVRSMMGEFGGNAGLLSAWFDIDAAEWQFEYRTCVLGKQHFWWAVHVLDIISLPVCLYVGWKLLKGEGKPPKAAGGKEKTL